jgi:hypothetical protein
MRLNYTIGKYIFEFGTYNRRKITEFKKYKYENETVWAWWKFHFSITDWTLEIYSSCACCGSISIGELGCGDESWTVCKGCGAVEQGYKYLNLIDYENADCHD